MTVIHAKTALLPDGWASDVCVTLAEGRIALVQPGSPAQGQQVGAVARGALDV